MQLFDTQKRQYNAYKEEDSADSLGKVCCGLKVSRIADIVSLAKEVHLCRDYIDSGSAVG